MNDLHDIVKNGLCAGCGTCAALCPGEAISLAIDEKQGLYVPVLSKASCVECGICIKICPGHVIDYHLLNQQG